MKTVVMDFRDFEDKAAAHRFLAAQLDFPDYYGHNLDALYDVLTSDVTDVNLLVLPGGKDWEQGFFKAFTDAAAENPGFSVGIRA